jgi:hypothetical protein
MATLTYKNVAFSVGDENIKATAIEIKYESRGQYKALLKGGGFIRFYMEENDWVKISKPDMKKYLAAKAAAKELEAARLKYREVMKSLKAITKSSGFYEDYESWLEIPGIPGINWEDV